MFAGCHAGLTGFEPVTPRFVAESSIQTEVKAPVGIYYSVARKKFYAYLRKTSNVNAPSRITRSTFSLVIRLVPLISW